MSGFGLGDDRVDRCTVRPTALSPVHGHSVNQSCLTSALYGLLRTLYIGYILKVPTCLEFNYWLGVRGHRLCDIICQHRDPRIEILKFASPLICLYVFDSGIWDSACPTVGVTVTCSGWRGTLHAIEFCQVNLTLDRRSHSRAAGHLFSEINSVA